MLQKRLPGETVTSYCTKCKTVIDHVIIATDGGMIMKVRCKTCGGRHKYRSAAPEKRSPRKQRKDAVLAAEVLWETCLAGAKGRERSYNMAGRYRIGDIVLHDTFGKGVVLKLHNHKCQVLFKDRERLMASEN